MRAFFRLTGLLATAVVLAAALHVPGIAQAKKKAIAGTDQPKNLNTKAEDFISKMVKPIGHTRRYDVLPDSGEQDCLAVTPTQAARLIDYSSSAHALFFSVLEMATGKLDVVGLELDKNYAEPFIARPCMARHGGENVVVFGPIKENKLQIVLCNWKTRKSTAVPCPDEKVTFKGEPDYPNYPLAMTTGGQQVMFVDSDAAKWRGGTPPSADQAVQAWVISSKGIIPIKWKLADYGVTPVSPECFAVTGKEIAVLTMRGGKEAAQSGVEFFVLSFDARSGAFKGAEPVPGKFQSDYPYMAPNADYVWLKPWGKYTSTIYARGTWKEGFSSDFHDACVGFSQDGTAGVFVSNIEGKDSALHAQLQGIALKDSKVLWSTTITQSQADGKNWTRAIKSVSAGASMIAATFGVLKGETAPEAKMAYVKRAVAPFKPHGAVYDKAGKQIAVPADDAVVFYDAKTKSETKRIDLADGPKKSGTCAIIQFDKGGQKLMVCVADQWTRVFEVSTGKTLQDMATPKGMRFRPLPDFGGVVFTQINDGASDLCVQTFSDAAPKTLHKAQFEEGKATCLYIDDKGGQFLVMEKGAGEGNLALIDKNGKLLETYALGKYSPYICDGKINAALMTPNKAALLIGADTYHIWVEPGKRDEAISGGCEFNAPQLKAVTAEYLQAGAFLGVYFSQPLCGDAALSHWATPYGVITHNAAQNAIRFLIWDEKPEGWVAVHPRGEEFIVVSATGMDIYSMK